ncbi:hypothetical protein SS50377_24601 [Spironucleus salmonicida]|uniref:Uncharacterized protein n=1 Tax=Spironucleus salmonicida TaxID=348837 RepID=V6LIW0_9EUKA|nr:hypothetical protein SS50377_24601 [Spironucleus salmonicida]|eukprot:EST44545.1 hypothetical protein SS50377_15545 [Spironucleus salmonicida]
MLEQLNISEEWELSPAHILRFARTVAANFQTMQTFIQQTQHSILELKVTSDKINHLDNQAQEAFSFAQKTEFQTTQQIGYLQLQLEKCQEQIALNDDVYNQKVKEIQQSSDQKYALQQQLSIESRKELESVLIERQREIDSTKDTLLTSQNNAKEIGDMFQTQIGQFYTQQTIYSQDFVKVQKRMYENSEKIQKMFDCMDEKMLNFEQNFFVGLTQRVMDCESQIQKGEYDKAQLNFSISKSSELIDVLNVKAQITETTNTSHQSNIQELQQHSLELFEKYNTNLELHELLVKKVNILRSDLIDQIGLEVQSREAEVAEVVCKTNSLIDEMGDLEDDLTRKINFCNDFVVNSGLQKEYNMSRRQEYESNLDTVFEDGCLEVGQIKLVKAITLRMREIENKLMQVIARTGGID